MAARWLAVGELEDLVPTGPPASSADGDFEAGVALEFGLVAVADESTWDRQPEVQPSGQTNAVIMTRQSRALFQPVMLDDLVAA
ncbi:MAG: hypothetical protein ACKOUR_13170 [Planctomycetota bacterium]